MTDMVQTDELMEREAEAYAAYQKALEAHQRDLKNATFERRMQDALEKLIKVRYEARKKKEGGND
jgi:hypothetical protein